jgi:hypothetical protein
MILLDAVINFLRLFKRRFRSSHGKICSDSKVILLALIIGPFFVGIPPELVLVLVLLQLQRLVVDIRVAVHPGQPVDVDILGAFATANGVAVIVFGGVVVVKVFMLDTTT